METTILEHKRVLASQLEQINETFSMASNDEFILMCNISLSEQNKLYTMYTHAGETIESWYEPLN